MTEANSEFLKGRRGRWTLLLTQLLHYGVALLSVVLAVGTNLLFSPYLAPTLTPPFFAAVMVSAWYGGLGSGLLATALSTLAINYFLVEPLYSLNIPSLGTLARLGVFVMAAILINSLNAAQRAAQRRAEANLQALRESEARFGRLAESNIIGIIVADLNGLILEANDIFLQMVGYTQEELRSGRVHWREMTPPESLEVSETAVQELITTGACSPFDKEYIRKDGSCVPVLHGAAMTGETTFIGFVLDLSDAYRQAALRKQAEAAQQEAARRERSLYVKIQAAKEQLETVLASINDQFLVLDRQWRYTYVNDRVVEVVGLSREDLLGKCIWEVFPETVGTQFYAEVHRATAEQRIVHFEYFYSPWQRWFENHIYPSAKGVSVLVTEITERKRAEETLQRTNQTLQTLIDVCPVAIAFFDPQGIVKLWNRAAERIFGWSASEAIGQFMPTVPHRPQEFLASIQTVLSGRSLDGLEAQHQRKDGRIVDLEIWANLTHDAQGNPGCLGIAWDITQRKQAEAALVAQEQRYRYIFEAVSVSIWEEDFSQVKAAIDQLKVAGVRDFHQYFAEHPEFVEQAMGMVRLRDMNQAALRMFGAQDKTQLLTSLHQIFVPETQDAFIGELLAIATEEPFFAAETELRTLQGDRFHVWLTIAFPSTSESYDRVLVSLLDISERKRVQQELQQTLQTLRTLIQASPLPIVVIEPDLSVKLWNAAAEQVFGWSEAELLGQLLPLVPEEKQEECRQLREAVTKGEVFFGVETYRRKRNGANVVLSISAAPLYDDRGRVNAILLILQDITE
ncbi:MAG: PAS domain S-box protein, partial [Coleofasciculus sp. Co-bin14]|nr:PAS domain S-box protein [Coleofasciculus sp. Co-bin14]